MEEEEKELNWKENRLTKVQKEHNDRKTQEKLNILGIHNVDYNEQNELITYNINYLDPQAILLALKDIGVTHIISVVDLWKHTKKLLYRLINLTIK